MINCKRHKKMNSSKNSGRSFCITINGDASWFEGPTQADELADFLRACDLIRYAVFQFETAPSTGRRHCQAYVYTTRNSRISAVKKIFNGWRVGCSPHIELARGNIDQAVAYCVKADTSVQGTSREVGSKPRQGSRSDLADIAAAIDEGMPLAEVAQLHPADFIRYSRGLQEYQRVRLSCPRSPETSITVYWWFGPTGTGKSRKAFSDYPDSYVKMPTNKWWDGYVAQTEVIMDDYRPAMCPFSELLRILDRYPMRVEMKGSSVDLAATTFIITTCQRPEIIWHGKTEEQIDQLLRRITEIVEFLPDGTTKVLKDGTTDYVRQEPVDMMILPVNPGPQMFVSAKKY